MPSPAVTLCRMSYHGLPSDIRAGLPPTPRDTCDNPVAPCSPDIVAHQSHNWRMPWDRTIGTHPIWRHCQGVPSVEEER